MRSLNETIVAFCASLACEIPCSNSTTDAASVLFDHFPVEISASESACMALGHTGDVGNQLMHENRLADVATGKGTKQGDCLSDRETLTL